MSASVGTLCALVCTRPLQGSSVHIAGAGPKGELSQLYGGVMHGVDLTPTDQLAAMLLLRQVQNARRHRHAQDRLVDPGAAPGKPSTVRYVVPRKVSAPFCESSLARLMQLPGHLLKWQAVHAGFPSHTTVRALPSSYYCYIL